MRSLIFDRFLTLIFHEGGSLLPSSSSFTVVLPF